MRAPCCLVSHDRDFLDRTVTVTLGLDGSGHVDVVAGGYADWEARKKAEKSGAPRAVAAAQSGGNRGQCGERDEQFHCTEKEAVVQGSTRLRDAAGADRGN